MSVSLSPILTIPFALAISVLKQEAPLTLRRSAAVAEILKGNPKYMGAFLALGHASFSSGCGFIMGLGKPKAVYQI